MSRSIDTQSGVTEIGNGVWLLYNVHNTRFCQVYSATVNSIETITVSEETVVQVPCNKTMTCFGNHLPQRLCTKYRVIISPTTIEQPQEQDKILKISMKNVTKRLLSAYRAQNIRTYQDMVNDFTENQPFLKQKIHEIGYTTLSIICSFLLLGIGYVRKCSSKKLKTDLDTLNEVIHDVLFKT